MARPTFKPTDEQRRLVEQFAAFGIPVEQMVHLITSDAGKPIAENTLRKHFRTELETGTVKANAKIARTLFEKASGGDTTAMIFWLKTRARWKEPARVEVTGADGGPVKTQAAHADLSGLSDEDLALLAALAEKLYAGSDPD